MSAHPGTPTRSDPAGRSAPHAAAALAPAEAALCRSALWEALALGFRPPTAETVGRLADPAGAADLAAAAAALDGAAGTTLAPLVLGLGLAPRPEPAALSASYDRLFGHTARGPVPPYETEYGADSLWEPQREMSDLGAFFRAFGLVLRPDARERPDHIACQCEFLMFLARKEARALALGEAGTAESTARAARLFLRDHTGRWAPAFAARLSRADVRGFYGALGRLLDALVTAECRRVGVPAGPPLLRLRSTEPDSLPMACGPAGCGPDA